MNGDPRPYLVALLLVVVGTVVFATFTADPADTTVAISRYEPPPSSVTFPDWVWTRGQLGGAALVVLGVLVGAATTGALVGRGRSGRP